MKKGFAQEFIGFLVVIISVVLLSLFFVSQGALKGGEVTRSVGGRNLDESANLALMALFNNEPRSFDKTYIEIAIDSIYQGENKTIVFYGKDVGVASSKQLLTSLFNDYLGEDRWGLKIETSNANIAYGNRISKREDVYNYESKIPLPGDEIGKVSLYVV
ncbi:MAG: hypothetical protein ABEK17_00375 [Candidatus Aenigmatarchaeota archaeon]